MQRGGFAMRKLLRLIRNVFLFFIIVGVIGSFLPDNTKNASSQKPVSKTNSQSTVQTTPSNIETIQNISEVNNSGDGKADTNYASQKETRESAANDTEKPKTERKLLTLNTEKNGSSEAAASRTSIVQTTENSVKETTAQTPQTEGKETGEKTYKTYVTTATLNIRSLPSTDGEILGQIQEGGDVDVYEINDEWAEISFSGTVAYVSANYIQEKATTALLIPETTAVTTDVGNRSIPQQPVEPMVWIPMNGGQKYHSRSN